MSDPYSALRDHYDSTHEMLAEAKATIATLTAEVDRLTGYSERLNGLRERLEDRNATLTSEIARYRLPRECGTCGAVQHGGTVLCAECAEKLTAERDDARAKSKWTGPWQEGAYTYQEAINLIATLTAERDALQARIKKSYIRNCYIKVRNDEDKEILSYRINGDEALIQLDGYAITPKEEYEVLTAERDAFLAAIMAIAEETWIAGFPAGDRNQTLSNVRALTAERDALMARLRTACEDWAEDDTALREALRPVLGAAVDGTTDGVPPLVDLVQQVVAKLASLEHDLHLAEQGHANAH